jgi:N-acetylglucosamine-6-sulfatase
MYRTDPVLRVGSLCCLTLLACLASALGPSPVWSQVSYQRIEGAAPRNIIFILCDDHRWDALGFLGHPFLRTPNMDRLAREGAYVRQAFVTTSLCSPSRASILTGLYAHKHEVVDNYHPVREDLLFFPQLLRAAGYETAFVGKWHMGGLQDEPQRGFDHWISFKGQGMYLPPDHPRRNEGRFVPQSSDDGYNVNGTRRIPQKGYITDELTDFALEWLSSRTGRKPFMLYLSHKAVHADFIPADRHRDVYRNAPFRLPATYADTPDNYRLKPRWVKDQRNSRHGVDFAYYGNLDLERYYKRYCESLLAVDESIGRILASLEQSGRLSSTLVVYMGDNGFLFGEHGLIDKRNAYEPSMRVPLLAHCPEMIKPGTVIDEVVANIDIAPTLLEAAGIARPPHMDGASFLSLVKGEQIPWRDSLLYEYFWEWNYPHTPTTHAVRDRRYKFIRYHGVWDLEELYDLQDDPHEQHNLVFHPEHAERVAVMRQQLFSLLRESDGMSLRLLPDRGQSFYHRRPDGARPADFPEPFYEQPSYGVKKQPR